MMAEGGIRESQYEPGVFFIPPEPGTTQQSIGTQQWKVGNKYKLQKVLGYGSFSAVCLAVDTVTGEKVALKRIADVLHSPEQAKRVLREICILRRLSHPNVIGLRDVFVRPAATGQCRLVGGKLVHISIDVYIAMEYADGGDLFHLKGQLSEEEVKSLMWQMSQTLRWLHTQHVWHRDLKSQNVFLIWENGRRVAKLGDFGSARSAIPEGYQWAEQPAPDPADALKAAGSSGNGRPSGGSSQGHTLHTCDSYSLMQAEVQPEDLYVRYETSGNGSRTGFKAPLTRVVATPCYRAPEVVMSRGGYTDSIDMWSLGCIFGELLFRIAHVGSAATPNLQVAPLFAIHGMPKTPVNGDSFSGNPGCQTTRRELQALFDVIGSPPWADVAAVQEHSWRQYLHRLPGKAPTLYRRFFAAGEEAVDLLSRLLAFDPARRASAEEALAHEYFADLKTEGAATVDDWAAAEAATTPSPSRPPREGLPPRPPAQPGGSGLPQPAAPTPFAAVAAVEGFAAAAAAAAVVATGGAAALQAAGRVQAGEEGALLGAGGDVAMAEAEAVTAGAPALESLPAEGPLPAASPAGSGASTPVRGAGGRAQGTPRYMEESNAGRALALLERELASLQITEKADPLDPSSQRLRQLMELEVAAIQAQFSGGKSTTPDKRRARVPQQSESGILRGLLEQRGAGLQEDTASMRDRTVDYGRERLSNIADTSQGRELNPERILGRQRHGEWTAFGSGQRTKAGPAWGVTSLPPGIDEATTDPKVLAVIRQQQKR